MKDIQVIIEKLIREHYLKKEEFLQILENGHDQTMVERLQKEARALRHQHYADKVFVRGLIEFTNYCKNNCYYCGIRAGNAKVHRYRLSKEEILACCREGYELGYKTFVLQGGEDPFYSDEKLIPIIKEIRDTYPDCAITLSVGERSKESYRALKEAGADRYLLRHETANQDLYKSLHPEKMSLKNRVECLRNLKKLGYQIGAGMMIGAPGQTLEMLAEDLVFLQELHPHMVGLGPFIPHQETCFAKEKAGDLDLTILILAIVRILLPKVLLPATTALATLDPDGREKGFQSGCNVVMPNMSPMQVRKDYTLYDNKISVGEESAQSLRALENRVKKAGFRIVYERGDSIDD